MAEKIITEMQPIAEVTSSVNFPADNGIQSFRVTAPQILAYIEAQLELRLEKTGVIKDWGGAPSSIPAGYLYCNGQAVSRTEYAALFAAIGTAHGSGDGSTTFNVPDRRGVFVRGMADGQTTDPNRTTRTARLPGGNTGDAVGSYQAQATRKNGLALTDPGHNHGIPVNGSYYGQSGPAHNMTLAGASFINGPDTNTSTNVSNITLGNGDSETRPVNVNAVFMIKT